MISFTEGRGSAAKKAPDKILQLRLGVAQITPRIWRRLIVRETMWLSRLHDSIQVLFDWFDYQTHAFTLGEEHFGNPVRRDNLAVEDDRDVTLADLDLLSKDRLVYDYQFGEGWQVEIRVEKTLPAEKGAVYPKCLAGERAGPPEDCGGVEAYKDMLHCLKQPGTDLGREWREWLGPDYDPEACDPEKINKALRRLAR